MSNIGVHDFAVPHEFVQPTRDMIIIQLPLPPKKVGSFIVPDMFRDMAQHNITAGRVVAMGPLAFTYKDGEGGLARQDVKLGDWVVIRPYAGTMMTGGKIQVSGGFRYVSSFQDVLGIVPSSKMPTADALLWKDDEEEPPKPTTQAAWPNNVRETIKG